MTVLVHPLIAAIPCLIIHWLISPGIRSYLLVLKIPRKAQIITVSKMSRADWRMDTNVINCFYWFHVVIEFRTFFRVYASCFVMRIRKTVKSTCRREKWEPNKGNKQAKKKDNKTTKEEETGRSLMFAYISINASCRVWKWPAPVKCRVGISLEWIYSKKKTLLFFRFLPISFFLPLFLSLPPNVAFA